MIKVATTAVILEDNRILIGQRTRDDRWELPGGKVDPGETPQECMRREIKEELNLDVKVEKSLGVLEGTYRGIPMKVYAFLLSCAKQEAVPRIHKEIRWIEPCQVDRFDIVEEDRIVLQKWQEAKSPEPRGSFILLF